MSVTELKELKKRAFGGKTSGFKDADEKNREKKHLKAYLAGKKTYVHGFVTNQRGKRERVVYGVLEIWTKES
jgi:hypothetical protein